MSVTIQWAQSVEIVICGRGKLGFLTDDLPPPVTIDPTYATWLADNSIVLAWLINSLEPNISRRYLWFKIANEVWDAVRRMYCSFASDMRVKIEDGSFSRVHVIGNITVSKDITLRKVLFVPSLKCNLISVRKLTHDCHCFATFSTGSCEFQDQILGKTIGIARIHDGLYYLERSSSGVLQSSLSCVQSRPSSSVQDIMLHHYRLVHPSFPYLSCLFPSLFINKNLHLIRCGYCELEKHTHVPFPKRKYTPSAPFTLIHNNLRRPSKQPTHHGKRWFLTFIDDHNRVTWVYLLHHKSDIASIFQISTK
ncbi:Beta-galactosidase [Dorcoceras hygrometricum]|uniref:Beta-galactosidase n=1 Tax=Dorcoceras hygrometricum TaxID=472368 RepID=A0A2Z7CNJ9_9LAMI|nr:Beta-galactosidase [Dorcoceras hygrometricum]